MPLACGIVSCAAGGLLSDTIVRVWGSPKWGRRLSGMLGLALAAVGTLLIPWIDNIWLLALAVGGAFFFSDLNMGPARAAAADIGGRAAGTVSGAMNMVGAFAGAAGMAFAGRLFAQGHAEVVFLVFAVLLRSRSRLLAGGGRFPASRRRRAACSRWIACVPLSSPMRWRCEMHTGRQDGAPRAHRVHHVSILVTDLAKAEEFYGGVLGLRQRTRPGGPTARAVLRGGRRPASSSRLTDQAEPASLRHTAFEVDDLEAALREVAHMGLPIWDDTPLPGWVRKQCRDPSGNGVELLQRVGGTLGAPTLPHRADFPRIRVGYRWKTRISSGKSWPAGTSAWAPASPSAMPR